MEGSRLHGISYGATFRRMIKGDCFTPKYEDFELEEEEDKQTTEEVQEESGTYEKNTNKLDDELTDLWEFLTTIKDNFLT